MSDPRGSVRPSLDELSRPRPDIAAGCSAALKQARSDGQFLWPARDPFGQRLPGYEFEDQEPPSVDLLDAVDARDVRVVQ